MLLDGQVTSVFAYFVADSRPHLQALQDGTAETVDVYTLDMAQGDLKEEFKDKKAWVQTKAINRNSNQ